MGEGMHAGAIARLKIRPIFRYAESSNPELQGPCPTFHAALFLSRPPLPGRVLHLTRYAWAVPEAIGENLVLGQAGCERALIERPA